MNSLTLEPFLIMTDWLFSYIDYGREFSVKVWACLLGYFGCGNSLGYPTGIREAIHKEMGKNWRRGRRGRRQVGKAGKGRCLSLGEMNRERLLAPSLLCLCLSICLYLSCPIAISHERQTFTQSHLICHHFPERKPKPLLLFLGYGIYNV